MPDSTQAQKSPEALREGLREIRSQRRLAHLPFVFVAFFAFFFGFIRANFPAFDGSFADKLILALLGVAMVPAVLLMMFMSVINLRCPRCREFFHAAKGRYRNDFARKCLNCGLRLDGRNASDAF
jgi:hypothetical protein